MLLLRYNLWHAYRSISQLVSIIWISNKPRTPNYPLEGLSTWHVFAVGMNTRSYDWFSVWNIRYLLKQTHIATLLKVSWTLAVKPSLVPNFSAGFWFEWLPNFNIFIFLRTYPSSKTRICKKANGRRPQLVLLLRKIAKVIKLK